MTQSWRLLIDGPQSGAHNMCLDEALLISGSAPTLRLYAWNPPTISLGYFQKHDQFTDIPEGWDVVRRLTGGGAIAHHHEITYSFNCDITHPFAKDSDCLYCKVHDAWQQAIATLGLELKQRGGERLPHQDKWCFIGGDPLDLVCADGRKVLGSAQRKTKDRLLMHGSIPLKTQSLMGGVGLEELLGRPLEWKTCVDQLLPYFCQALGLETQSGKLLEKEKNLLENLKKARYSDSNWVKERKSSIALRNEQNTLK